MLPNFFTLDVSLGNLLSVGAILGGWLVFLTTLRGQIQLLAQALGAIDSRILAVEHAMSTFTQNTIALARAEVRIDSAMQRIEDLERHR